jgi:hypothetical protein
LDQGRVLAVTRLGQTVIAGWLNACLLRRLRGQRGFGKLAPDDRGEGVRAK